MAANIGVFVDPACPWAWITSRWITEVAPKRALTIRWRSFSPDVRDGGVRLAPAIPKHLRHVALERRRIGAVALQVFEWLRNEVGEQAVERFYTQLGYRLNDPDRPGRSPMPGIIGAALKAAGLDEGAETAASDPIWQRHVIRSTQEAMAIVGRDAMTPVIAVETDPPTALSGPILSSVPAGADALRLWDVFAALLESPHSSRRAAHDRCHSSHGQWNEGFRDVLHVGTRCSQRPRQISVPAARKTPRARYSSPRQRRNDQALARWAIDCSTSARNPACRRCYRRDWLWT
jgi:hypothetical protein